MCLCLKYFLCFLNIFILLQTIDAKLTEPGAHIENAAKPIIYGCETEITTEFLSRLKSIENIYNQLQVNRPDFANGELSSKDHEKIAQNLKSALESSALSKDNIRDILEGISANLRNIKQAQAELQNQTKLLENKINTNNPTQNESVVNNFLQSLEEENVRLTERLQVALTNTLEEQNSRFMGTMDNQSFAFYNQLAELFRSFGNDLMPNMNQNLKNILEAENLARKNSFNENQVEKWFNDVKRAITTQSSKCEDGGLKSELQDFLAKSIKDALKDQQKLMLDSLLKQPKAENLKFSDRYLASATGICNAKNGLPENCEEALRGNPQCGEGVYLLYVPGFNLDPFFAYCLPDYTTPSLPTWTIIQRRQNMFYSFLRGWSDYRDGFGNTQSSYWLGLKYIHALTSRQNYELRIDMEDWESLKRYATYDKFVVGSEQNKFPLSLLGKFRGNAGDSLTIHVGQKFTTIDSDNDQRLSGNCAKDCAGGWWYVDCHVSNPNGIYNSTELYKGINWKSWRGYNYSYKKFYMAIRPKKV